jgi:membrane-bound serine protease (ClpP class)
LLLLGAILLAVFVLPTAWGIVAVATALVVEVAETWFWIRLSRRRRARVGAEALIGALGEAVTECRPEGYVRVAGELWQARCPDGADVGQPVRVVARDDLTLSVERSA